MTLVLTNEDVADLLSMEECIDAMEHAFRESALGRAMDRPRAHSYFPTEQPNQVYLFKSFEGGILSDGIVACRLCSYTNEFIRVGDYSQNKRGGGSAAERGMVLLFSMETGEPLCILPDRHIQGSRVAATFALATRYLAREDTRVLGLYGSGLQARSGLQAHCLVRPFKKIQVYSPTPDHRKAFAREMESVVGVEIEPVDDPRAVMKGADVVYGAAATTEPILRGAWLETGMHVTAVNPCSDDEALARVDLFVRNGGGQPQNFYCGPVEVGNRTTVESTPRIDLSRAILLGDLILGRSPSRASPEQITSFGLTGGEGGRGIQFAAAGAHIYRKALEQGRGQKINLEWALQGTPL